MEEVSSFPHSLSSGRELLFFHENMENGGNQSVASTSLATTETKDQGHLRISATTRKTVTHPPVDNHPHPQLNGALAPVILRRNESSSIKLPLWQPPTDWHRNAFVQRVGHLAQYLKDSTVQPYRDANGDLCVVTGTQVVENLPNDVLFFTNNQENDAFLTELRKDLPKIPSVLRHIDGFEVFSALTTNQSHSFHKHGESWLGQVEGRRQWWFLPPSTQPAPQRVNACTYLNDGSSVKLLPADIISFTQHPGDIVWFPKDWYHATCALDEWTVGIGWQQGPTIRQSFPKLNTDKNNNQALSDIDECLRQRKDVPQSITSAATATIKVTKSAAQSLAKDSSPPSINQHDPEWKWFDGDLNAYYNSLTTDENHKRDPNDISSYAVHRWLGNPQNTETHYQLLHEAMKRHSAVVANNNNISTTPLRVLDAGCGLGAGLMWMEQQNPRWTLTGYTISEEQHKFITKSLPPHHFQAKLQSFDDLSSEKDLLHIIYSVEALIHSQNMTRTLEEWTRHLAPEGVIVLIDDFLAPNVNKTGDDIQDFAKSWLANSLVNIPELSSMAQSMGLELVEDHDLIEEFQIIQVNYKNKMPVIQPFGGRTHQGWMGSKWRQRLTVEGKLKYDLVVLKKKPDNGKIPEQHSCAFVPKRNDDDTDRVPEIMPQLMSGKGKSGGQPISCISGWYCCDKGIEWYQSMTHNRTEKKVDYLHLDESLFGHYMEVFARHLNSHYSTYPINVTNGRFLDIGGTGSTASGMQQVTSKFQNFVGPLEYWKLDSDPAAKSLERTLYCDIDDCPVAETCSFDVTFSHTVLEHSQRPWLAFDEISRVTKSGGLTLHLVPWSYQYHATPGDHFRFSHTALRTLLEDRGFEVLEVGYDICTKQEKKRKTVDEHYDIIWLSYVVGRKK